MAKPHGGPAFGGKVRQRICSAEQVDGDVTQTWAAEQLRRLGWTCEEPKADDAVDPSVDSNTGKRTPRDA